MAGPTQERILKILKERENGVTVDELRAIKEERNLRLPKSIRTVLYNLEQKGWLKSQRLNEGRGLGKKRWYITPEGLREVKR